MFRHFIFLLSAVSAIALTSIVSGCGSDAQLAAPTLADAAQAISATDPIYPAGQTSNTVSAIYPSTNTLLGTVALGKPRPDDLLGALYNQQAPTLVATITTGADPHGIWPSPDNSRVYVCLEKQDAMQVVDTVTRTVISTLKIGQLPQALVYVANAVLSGDGKSGLTMQDLNLRVTATNVAVAGGGDAEAVVRELQGLDSVDVQAKELVARKTYQVLGLNASGSRQLVADFKTGSDGKGSANPLIKFFDTGMTGVLVAAAN